MVKGRSGFTLTEVLITVAIVGVIAMLAPQIMTQMTKFFVLSRTRLALQQEARAAIYVITREIRQGQSDSIYIDQIAGQPYYSRIRFTKLSGGVGTSVTVAQNGSSLILTEGVNISTMTTHLAFLSFTFPRSEDLTIVSVALTLQDQIYNGMFKALHMASEKVRVMN